MVEFCWNRSPHVESHASTYSQLSTPWNWIFSFKLDYFVHFMSMHCAHYIVNNKPGEIIAEITSPFTTYKSVPDHKIPQMEYRTPWNVRIIFVELILNLDMLLWLCCTSFRINQAMYLNFNSIKWKNQYSLLNNIRMDICWNSSLSFCRPKLILFLHC